MSDYMGLDGGGSSLEGLKRAAARQAPKGYEDQLHWQTEYGGDPAQLEGLYKQREADRSRAYMQEHPHDFQAAQANAMSMGNRMAGYMEALYHNDNQAQAGGIPKFAGNRAGTLGAPNQIDNPAGMTESASQGAAQQFAAGGALPDFYQGALPATQRKFQTNTQRALAALKRGR
jgi:hypothetical protein